MFTLNTGLLQGLAMVLLLIVVDVILGVCVSLKSGTFSLGTLPAYLESQVLPYYLSLMALTGLAQVTDTYQLGFTAIAGSSMGIYAVKMIFVDIKAKVITLFGSSSSKKIMNRLAI